MGPPPLLICGLRTLLRFLINVGLWPIVILLTAGNEIVRGLFSLLLLPSRYSLIRDGSPSLFSSPSWSSPFFLVGLYIECPEDTSSLEKNLIVAFRDKVLNRKDPDGELSYGMLYNTLVSKWGFGCWRDDKDTIFFDVKNHVGVYDPDGGGNKDKDVWMEAEVVSEIVPSLQSPTYSPPTPPLRPLWEWIIIPKVKRPNSTNHHTLLIFKCHQAYMDTHSALTMMGECLLQWGDWNNAKPPFLWGEEKEEKFKSLFLWMWALFSIPSILMEIWSNLVLDFIERKVLKRGGSDSRCYVPFFGEVSAGNTISYSTPSSVDLKRIKKIIEVEREMKTDIKIPSVFATSLLFTMKESTTQPVNQLCFALPILGPMRPTGIGTRPLTNFSAFRSTVGISLKTPGITSWTTLRPDRPSKVYLPLAFGKWLGRFPLSVVKTLWSGRVLGGATIGFNNFPYSRIEGLLLGGMKVQEVVVWPSLVRSIGLQLTFLGYGDKVCITASSYGDCMNREGLQTFMDAFLGRLRAICSVYNDDGVVTDKFGSPLTPRLSIAFVRKGV